LGRGATDGTQLGSGWSDSDAVTPDSNGIYSTDIGDEDLTPRERLLTVPYAIHAATADTALSDAVNDADADPTNELNTAFALNGASLELTDANGKLSVDLSGLSVARADRATTASHASTADTALNDAVDDADADAANELQTLSLNGANLTLSDGGGTISIADSDSNSSNELQNLTLTGNALGLSGSATSFDLADNFCTI